MITTIIMLPQCSRLTNILLSCYHDKLLLVSGTPRRACHPCDSARYLSHHTTPRHHATITTQKTKRRGKWITAPSRVISWHKSEKCKKNLHWIHHWRYALQHSATTSAALHRLQQLRQHNFANFIAFKVFLCLFAREQVETHSASGGCRTKNSLNQRFLPLTGTTTITLCFLVLPSLRRSWPWSTMASSFILIQ